MNINQEQQRRENQVGEFGPSQHVLTEQNPTERPSPGFFHNLGEKIGLVAPTPNETHFSKKPGLDPYPTITTNNPTSINGAELTDHIHVEEKPSLVERAKDYMYGAGEWIGIVGNRSEDRTWHEAAEHAAFDKSKDPLGHDKFPETGQKVLIDKPPFSQTVHDKLAEERLHDQLSGQRVGLVDKPLSEKVHDQWTEVGQRVGLFERSMSEKAKDKFTEAGQKIGLFEKPAHESAQEKFNEAGQKVGLVDKPVSEKAQDKLTEAGQKVGLVDKPVNEKVKDKFNETGENAKSKFYEVKDSAVDAAEKSKLDDQRSFTEKAKDYLYGIGERTGLVNSHPDLTRARDDLQQVTEKAFEVGENAKSYSEMAADRLREAGEKVGLKTQTTTFDKPTTDFKTDFTTDYTDMEGQTLIFPNDINSKKTLPA